ncbi:MAG: serine/threonine protein kinase, partial [Ardenticatenaceae bacterium]
MILPNNTNLQNRYLIVGLLGQGGFGAVYEARHLGLGHRVALKQLTLADPRAEKAFEREARILARLRHAALPRVSDYFVYSNHYFLVMEYVEGHDFEALLAGRTDPFPVEQVLGWADQLLDGLEYLHNQQRPVIHRDIKPGNIIKLTPAKVGNKPP